MADVVVTDIGDIGGIEPLVLRLGDAIERHVAPGMHLHFASTPSRSNAAIREVARAFLGTRPASRLSGTGFHSTMHLLPALGMAARLTACFFGDHYPAPRPNPLYTRLADEGVVIEHWALWSMVASLRAGAQGDDWVINRSLRGTTLASELAARGDYREIAVPGVPDVPLPGRPPPTAARAIGLCAALRPDVTFVHAAAADDEGHVIQDTPEMQAPPAPPTRHRDPVTDRLIVAGARRLVVRTRAIGARVLIAGIGQAFLAARMAQVQLAAAGYPLRVMVETGLYDVDCGAGGHGYLLAYDNVIRARRLSAIGEAVSRGVGTPTAVPAGRGSSPVGSIDDVLGVLACGADNRCIAALGAAQIDRRGNLNSTRLGGKLLVGSGGACDIAASVEEVVVLARLTPGRLVDDVEYVTSSGRAVGSVVTDRAVLTRPRPRDASPRVPGGVPGDRGDTWTIASLLPADPDQTVEQAIAALSQDCPWRLVHAPDLGFAAPITADEARLLDTLGGTPGEVRS